MTRVVLVIALVTFLSACSSATKGRCYKVREYQSAEDAERLKIPADLQQLDGNLRLEIPEGERNTTATPKGEECLDRPPPYFREG